MLLQGAPPKKKSLTGILYMSVAVFRYRLPSSDTVILRFLLYDNDMSTTLEGFGDEADKGPGYKNGY